MQPLLGFCCFRRALALILGIRRHRISHRTSPVQFVTGCVELGAKTGTSSLPAPGAALPHALPVGCPPVPHRSLMWLVCPIPALSGAGRYTQPEAMLS